MISIMQILTLNDLKHRPLVGSHAVLASAKWIENEIFCIFDNNVKLLTQSRRNQNKAYSRDTTHVT